MPKSGNIAIVGRPNAGKSTLLNALLGQKVAIMSDKPNTTRHAIAGILNQDGHQLVFFDTPGIHKPQQQLGRVLNKNAYVAIEDCDVIAWIVDGSLGFGQGDQFIYERIKKTHKPIIALFNQIDRLDKKKLLQRLTKFNEQFEVNEIVPISALEKDNLAHMVQLFIQYLPEGIALYPMDMKTDHDQSFQWCELVREKILWHTHEEIPHSVAVVLEKVDEQEDQLELSMLVIVDRASQKGMLIGKQGKMIAQIRWQAEKELSQMMTKPVHLSLHVRVETNWRNQAAKIKAFGIDEYSDD